MTWQRHRHILKLRLSKLCVSASKILGLFGLWVCSTFTISFRQYIVAICCNSVATHSIWDDFGLPCETCISFTFIFWNHSVCRSHISRHDRNTAPSQRHCKRRKSCPSPWCFWRPTSHGSKMACHSPYGVAFGLCRNTSVHNGTPHGKKHPDGMVNPELSSPFPQCRLQLSRSTANLLRSRIFWTRAYGSIRFRRKNSQWVSHT